MGNHMLLIRHDGCIVYANKAAVESFGYPPRVLFRRRITEFFKNKISLSRWQKEYFARLEKSRKPVTFEVERLVRSGETRQIDVTAVYFPWGDQKYMLAVARDITEKRQIQAQLKESENLYRLISEGAADGIFTVDLTGRTKYANRSLEDLVHISFQESLGTHFTKYVHRDSLKKAIGCFLSAQKGHSGIREEIDILDRYGHPIPVEVNVSPLYRMGKMVAVHAIIRDIRQRKQLEALAREAETIRATNTFIAGIAREIKFPLQAISARVHHLLKKYQKREFEYIGFKEFKEIMDTIDGVGKQVDDCRTAMDQMLVLSQKRTGAATQFSKVNACLREVLETLAQPMRLANVKVRLRLAEEPSPVALGPIEMKHVIANIILNAVEAMPGGGQLTITTRYFASRRQVVMEFKDEGIGILQDNLSRIFEPFFTTKYKGPGKRTGLGLTIVRSILKASRGDVTIRSSLRQGTTVSIFLPLFSIKKRKK